MTALFPEILPDLPGRVHGIKSRDPWTVQCDDCLTVVESEWLLEAVKSATFRHAFPGLRLCDGCWSARGVRKRGYGATS